MMKAGTPDKLAQEPIGTGPFYLLQYQKDAIIRYRAFPQYYAGKATLDDLVFAITPDSSVRWAKLQKGECHVMPYPNPADVDAMRKDPNVQVLEQPGLNIGYLAYNTKKKPFDDVRVRKAMNMAHQQEGHHRRGLPLDRHRRQEPDPADLVVVQRHDQGRSVRSGSGQEAARRSRDGERLLDRPVGDAGAAALQPQRPPHRRIDAGRPRQGRGEGRDQVLRVGRVPQARPGGRAPDRDARLDRRQRRPRQLPPHPARLRRGAARRRQHRKWCDKTYDDLVNKAKTISDKAERTKLTSRRRWCSRSRRPGSPSRTRCS